MNISKILKQSSRPSLYTPGSAKMWTDPHIQRQLLAVHLNPDIDLGSRKVDSIRTTCEWILSQAPGERQNILDLGCGPGLYTEFIAERGHGVTGVDFNETSIRHAGKRAKEKGMGIEYIHANYLELTLEDRQFDLITMIFTDFGVLLPKEREILLDKIRGLLLPGGVFIFDVLNDRELEKKTAPKNWECEEKGFWRGSPYLTLSESFLYEEDKVILYQHIVEDEKSVETYRFWTHFFSHGQIESELATFEFGDMSFHEDVLPEGDLWNGKNVTFCRAVMG